MVGSELDLSQAMSLRYEVRDGQENSLPLNQAIGGIYQELLLTQPVHQLFNTNSVAQEENFR